MTDDIDVLFGVSKSLPTASPDAVKKHIDTISETVRRYDSLQEALRSQNKTRNLNYMQAEEAALCSAVEALLAHLVVMLARAQKGQKHYDFQKDMEMYDLHSVGINPGDRFVEVRACA